MAVEIETLAALRALVEAWQADEACVHHAAQLAPLLDQLEEELVAIRRRQSEDLTQMAQTARMAELGMMAAAVFHEMNQPLLGIKGFAEIGADQHQAGRYDKLGGHLQEIRKQVLRIQDMQKRVKTFLSHGQELAETFRLGPCVEETLALFRYRIHSHRVEVQEEIPEDLPLVRACRKHIQQVLINLVANALDAQSQAEQSRIWIRADSPADSGMVRLLVADFGPGVDRQIRDRIFDPFVTDKGEKGTGLGLYISRKLLRANGGKLELLDPAQSPWEEKPATVFSVEIPMAQKTKESEPA